MPAGVEPTRTAAEGHANRSARHRATSSSSLRRHRRRTAAVGHPAGLAVGLRSAVEGLYAAFAGYPLRAHVDGCPCCTDDADHRRIHARPLRELSGEDLSRFAFKALTTWGTADDLRHFLPRLLELIAFDDLEVNPEIVLGKLVYADWRSWPPTEQSAVERYADSLWRTFLASFPSAVPPLPDADTALCTVAQVVDDLRPLLAYWQGVPCIAHLRHLARFVVQDSGHLMQTAASGFWEERPAQWEQVRTWRRDPSLRQVLEEGFFRHAHEPFADELAAAADALRV